MLPRQRFKTITNTTTIKTLLILLTFLLFSSCENKIDTKLIVGRWASKDVVDKTGLNAKDKLTFYKNDSMTIEIFTDGKLYSKMFGIYKIDSTTKTLNISAKDTTENINITYTHDLIKLTQTELELKYQNSKSISRYIRD